MQIIIIIAVLILLAVLAFKVTKKLIKVAIAVLFVGFTIYLVTGTDIISEFLEYFGLLK